MTGEPSVKNVSTAALKAPTVSLWDAVEFLRKRVHAAQGSCSGAHIAGVIHQIRGVIWLMTGGDPGSHDLWTVRDILCHLHVPFIAAPDPDGVVRLWYGDDYAQRAGRTMPKSTKFRQKTMPVDAEQFDPLAETWPQGVHRMSGKYAPTAIHAKAYGLQPELCGWLVLDRLDFDGEERGRIVTPGQWIVTPRYGERSICSADGFAEIFEPV